MKLLTALAAITLTATPTAETEPPAALDVLENITIAEDHPMDGYDRETQFAPSGWTDTTGNGCTTREDILARDLDQNTIVTDDCTVEYGQITDAYSGTTIEHNNGSSQVDIEHVVAVGQAWRNGAHAWDNDTRQQFYQDQENLIAVSASENQAKGSKDASEYLPEDQSSYCQFAASTVYIKDKYDLNMNPAEHQTLEGILTTPECKDAQAAPAQSIYTTDWRTPSTAAPAEDNQNTLTSLPNLPPLALAGLIAVLALILTVLVTSRKARKGATRILKRQAKRSIRKGLRSLR